MKNEKLDLQVGDKVTYKDLDRNEIYTQIINYTGSGKDLMNTTYYEIIKIERPKYEVVEEKKELLTEEEKEFLKIYIKFIESLKNGQVISIRKQSSWIVLKLKTGLDYQTDIGSKFKNMEDCKTYSLLELGLEEEK